VQVVVVIRRNSLLTMKDLCDAWRLSNADVAEGGSSMPTPYDSRELAVACRNSHGVMGEAQTKA
jgi:hypothetical protein